MSDRIGSGPETLEIEVKRAVHRNMHSLTRPTQYCSAGRTRVGCFHARFVDPTIQTHPMKQMSTLCGDILDGTFREDNGHAYRAVSIAPGYSW